MAIRIFGDSHLNALIRSPLSEGKGWEFHWTSGKYTGDLQFEDRPDGLRVMIPGVDDAGQLTPARVDVTLTEDDICFFSGPFHTSRIARYPAWLTHIPQTMYQGGDALIVTTEEITRHVDAYYARAFDFLKAAREHDLRLLVLESPRLLPRVEQFWDGDTAVVAEVDRIVREHVRARIKALRIGVIQTPVATYDGAWTKPDFAAKKQRDVHHGNRRFGTHVIRRIEAHIERLTPAK